MKFAQFVLLAVLFVSTLAFFDEDSDVTNLTVANFDEKVKDSSDFWLIEFYAPWCGHCKKLAPEWNRAAKGLKGIVNMGAVDMTKEGDAGKDYNVEGYPTLKFFGEDKANPEDFEGGRSSVGIINYATRKLKEIANARIGNKKRAKAEKPKEEKQPEPEPEAEAPTGDDDVVVLTDSNFAEELEASQEPWFVEFYAPWCGHCKTLAPVWVKLAAALKGKVRIAKVDATENGETGKRFGVQGYPSLKWFPGGTKSDSTVEEYNGGRDLDALLEYAERLAAMSAPAKFTQLVSQDVYTEYCQDIKGVCVIVFIPSLADSSVDQRATYISQIEEVANASKGKPFTFLWSEGGQNYEFENSFNVGGSGYPAVLAITVKKSKYATLRASFTSDNFSKFVSNIGGGKQVFSNFNHNPQVKTVAAWVEEEQQEQKNEDL